MDASTVGSRVRSVREANGLTRKEFAARLACPEGEIVNVEFDRLKKPEQKESLYRNISVEFSVSLEWIKTGAGSMYGTDPQDEISIAFGSLRAMHDPVVDGFVEFFRTRTQEQRQELANQLRELVSMIDKYSKKSGD